MPTKQFLFSFLILFFLFWFFAARGIDPDFGWHLRMGQIVLAHGIPATDPFSYTMPSFPFVDHEWLTNVGIASLYPLIGYSGLAGICAFLATFAIAIHVRSKPFLLISIPVLLMSQQLIYVVGVRPQIITWFFFSLLIFLGRNNQYWQKIRYGIPLLILIWTNLHGGFAIGIAFLILMSICSSIEKRSLAKADMVVLMLSIVATFGTPYGYRIWGEVFMQMTDTNLRWSITEWFPLFSSTISLPLLLLLTISGMTVVLLRKEFSLSEKLLSIGLFCAGVLSIRHIQLWQFSALPISIKGIVHLKNEAKKYSGGLQRVHTVLLTLLIVLTAFLLATVVSSLHDSRNVLDESDYYPAKAVMYLRKHLPKGNILSSYNWGGYLIWKLPEKKVFVDGRMPSWRWKNAPPTESANAFADFQLFSEGKMPLQTLVDAYRIDTLLLPIQKPTKPSSQQKSQETLTEQLQKSGWRILYSDTIATIYQKKTL